MTIHTLYFEHQLGIASFLDTSLLADYGTDKHHYSLEIANNSLVSTKNLNFNTTTFVFLFLTTALIGLTFFCLLLIYRQDSQRERERERELVLENSHFHSISQFSNELLFRFNTKDNTFNFVNDDNNPLHAISGLESMLQNYLVCANDEGVNILTHKSKKEKHVFKVYHLVPDHATDYILGKIVDIKDEFKEKEKLILDSRTDGLTGLHNASYTKDTVDLLIRKRPTTRKDALLIVDLDSFKGINDSLGHYEGDKVLIDVAKSLNSVFNNAIIIGRIGGDEFMVYISDVECDKNIFNQTKEFSRQLETLDYPVSVEASVGVCILENRMGYEEAFTQADISLYDMKKITKQSRLQNS